MWKQISSGLNAVLTETFGVCEKEAGGGEPHKRGICRSPLTRKSATYSQRNDRRKAEQATKI